MEAIFEPGEAPPEAGLAPELVVGEAGGTYLKAQREGQPSFEVKTGVSTGKERAGGATAASGSSRRAAPQQPQTPTRFGKGLAARGFAWVGPVRGRFVLCVPGGLDSYGRASATGSPGPTTRPDPSRVGQRTCEVSGRPGPVRGTQAPRLLRPPGLRPPAPALPLPPPRARGGGRLLLEAVARDLRASVRREPLPSYGARPLAGPRGRGSG